MFSALHLEEHTGTWPPGPGSTWPQPPVATGVPLALVGLGLPLGGPLVPSRLEIPRGGGDLDIKKMGPLQSTCCGRAPRCASIFPHTTTFFPPGTPRLSLDCSSPQPELTLWCLQGPQQVLSKRLPRARCCCVNAGAGQRQLGPLGVPDPAHGPHSRLPILPPLLAAPPALPTSQQAGPPLVAFTPR